MGISQAEAVNELANKVFEEKKLSLFRKYILEVMFVVVVFAVVYLFIALFGLQNEFRTYVITNSLHQSDVINNNTRVVEENTKVIQKNNELQQQRLQQAERSNKIDQPNQP